MSKTIVYKAPLSVGVTYTVTASNSSTERSSTIEIKNDSINSLSFDLTITE